MMGTSTVCCVWVLSMLCWLEKPPASCMNCFILPVRTREARARFFSVKRPAPPSSQASQAKVRKIAAADVESSPAAPWAGSPSPFVDLPGPSRAFPSCGPASEPVPLDVEYGEADVDEASVISSDASRLSPKVPSAGSPGMESGQLSFFQLLERACQGASGHRCGGLVRYHRPEGRLLPDPYLAGSLAVPQVWVPSSSASPPFGISLAPQTFTRCMNAALAPMSKASRPRSLTPCRSLGCLPPGLLTATAGDCSLPGAQPTGRTPMARRWMSSCASCSPSWRLAGLPPHCVAWWLPLRLFASVAQQLVTPMPS